MCACVFFFITQRNAIIRSDWQIDKETINVNTHDGRGEKRPRETAHGVGR